MMECIEFRLNRPIRLLLSFIYMSMCSTVWMHACVMKSTSFFGNLVTLISGYTIGSIYCFLVSIFILSECLKKRLAP